MRNINENFIPYAESLDLKAFGVNKEQISCYGNFINEKLALGFLHSTHCNENTVLGLTYGQAFEFIRDKYGLHGWVSSKTVNDGKTIFIPNGRTIPDIIKKNLVVDIIPYMAFEKFNSAELECLRVMIQFIKEKK